jgi:hypothetical protein
VFSRHPASMSSEMTVSHLLAWCLVTECEPCRQTAELPVHALRHRGVHVDAPITEAAQRLRCEKCGLALQAVWLIEGPHDRADYPPIRLVWHGDGLSP